MKTAVIFHSLSGNTRRVAGIVAGELGADILELKTRLDMGKSGLRMYFFAGMQAAFKAKPRLEDYSLDWRDYDLIVLGTPVWGGNFSSAIRSFFAQERISGKRIALFATCGNSPGQAINNMKSMLKGNEVIREEVFIQARNKPEEESEKALIFAGKIRLDREDPGSGQAGSGNAGTH